MAGAFKLDPNWFKNITAKWEEDIDAFSARVLENARAFTPRGGTPKTAKGRKRHKARKHVHLRDTGRVISSSGTLTGGFEFTAPHAWFVERGHKVGGAVKGGGRVAGRYFMLKALLSHEAEIKDGTFLKG